VLDDAIGEMRTLRNVKPGEDNDFEIETNESLATSFAGFTGYLTMFGFASGAIALIAAGVGIMNIMLVSVKERTREIGVRKAIGAKRWNIMTQFVIEAVTLCQIGGVIGIILGFLGGLGLSAAAGFTSSSVPIDWVLGSVGICTFLGILFGSYPAWKAASLDPIEALRYE
jgi:putative ABC transport system permease protein